MPGKPSSSRTSPEGDLEFFERTQEELHLLAAASQLLHRPDQIRGVQGVVDLDEVRQPMPQRLGHPVGPDPG